jgi:hypothetical protein
VHETGNDWSEPLYLWVLTVEGIDGEFLDLKQSKYFNKFDSAKESAERFIKKEIKQGDFNKCLIQTIKIC